MVDLICKAELFDGASGKPLTFAQDPTPLANGSWLWSGYDNITASDPLGRWFVFCDSRVEHWKAAAASSHGLFLFGHWGDMVRNFA